MAGTHSLLFLKVCSTFKILTVTDKSLSLKLLLCSSELLSCPVVSTEFHVYFPLLLSTRANS